MPTDLASDGNRRQPRILLITARADHGGGPRHILDLLNAMRNASIDFYIAAPNQQPYFTRYKELCRDTIQIPARMFSIASFFEILRFIYGKKIDIIHSHGRGAGIYSRLLGFLTGVPVLHTFHGIHREPSLSGKLKLFVDRILAHTSFIPVFVAENEKAEAVHYKVASSSHNGFVVENAVDMNRFKRRSTRRPLESNSIQIGSMLRADHAKGPDLFVRLSSANKTLGQWSCIGIDPIELSQFNDVPQELKILGRVSEPEDWLSHLDIYVSTSRTEGLPLGVLEAMAAGCICILSDIPAHRAFYTAGAALLFTPDQPESFATQIAKLHSDPHLWDSLLAKSAELIQSRHSLNSFRQRLEKIYLETYTLRLCPICGNVRAKTKNTRFRYETETAIVRQCTACKTAFLSPQPSDAWLSHEYSGYYTRRSSGDQKLENFRRFFQRQSPKKFKNILEIGGGEGACAKALLESVPESTLTVVEAHPDAARYYSSIRCRLISTSLEHWLKTNNEKYELILMFDVLEHVRNPRFVIDQLAECLSPGGEIWLSVPSYSSISRRILGNLWPQYKPEHLFYFSNVGIQTLFREFTSESLKIIRHKKHLPISYLLNVGSGFGPKLLKNVFRFLKHVLPEFIQRSMVSFCLGERLIIARLGSKR